MLLKPPIPPMEARSVEEIPIGDGWQYEPKWDGFRCLAFRDGDEIFLQSKNGQPLARYFPDVADNVATLPHQRFVLDGELVDSGWRRTFVRPIATTFASCRESRPETGRSSSSRLHRVRSACGERELIFETESARAEAPSGKIRAFQSTISKNRKTFPGN